MENGNIEHAFQGFFNVKAFRRLDILQVDAAKGRGDGCHHLDDLIRVMGIHFDIEHINIGELLEQYPFAFHHRLACQRAAVTEPQDSCAIRDHSHQVPLGRVFIGIRGVLFDLQDRFCHAR